MFGIFKKKSEKEKLQIAYSKKLEEAFKMSTVNRVLSDKLSAEADAIAKQIEKLP